MRVPNKACADVFDVVHRFVLLFVMGACVFLSACKVAPSWSAESKSPDGKMMATAKTIDDSGPGTDFMQTTVYLNWVTNKNSPTMILAFSDGPPGPNGMKVGMNWLTPTHLELTYEGQRNLDFQSVKFGPVTITVRDLSEGTPRAAQ